MGRGGGGAGGGGGGQVVQLVVGDGRGPSCNIPLPNGIFQPSTGLQS